MRPKKKRYKKKIFNLDEKIARIKEEEKKISVRMFVSLSSSSI